MRAAGIPGLCLALHRHCPTIDFNATDVLNRTALHLVATQDRDPRKLAELLSVPTARADVPAQEFYPEHGSTAFDRVSTPELRALLVSRRRGEAEKASFLCQRALIWLLSLSQAG